jgi:hypothetical protein
VALEGRKCARGHPSALTEPQGSGFGRTKSSAWSRRPQPLCTYVVSGFSRTETEAQPR